MQWRFDPKAAVLAAVMILLPFACSSSGGGSGSGRGGSSTGSGGATAGTGGAGSGGRGGAGVATSDRNEAL